LALVVAEVPLAHRCWVESDVLSLSPSLPLSAMNDIRRVERPDGKRKGLTGVACLNETSAPSARRSCNSTPSSIRPFRVREEGFLAHCRKRGWVDMSSVW
jgi:hypothetical protein